jgi:hypothetical protein
MNFLEEATKITEAYCVRNHIPTRRQFTDADLVGPMARLTEAQEQLNLAESFSAGRRIGRLRLSVNMNPHPEGSPAHAEWLRGWQIETADLARSAA